MYEEKKPYPKLCFGTPNDKCLIAEMVPVISSHTTRSNLTNMR